MTPVSFKLIGIDALIIITAHHHLTLFYMPFIILLNL